MIDLVAIDVDLTLLNDQEKISPRTLAVLNQCQKEGVKIILASGRNEYEINELLQRYDLSLPLICGNGAVVFDENGRELSNCYLNEKEIDAIADIEEESKVNILFFDNFHLYSLNSRDTFLLRSQKATVMKLYSEEVIQNYRRLILNRTIFSVSRKDLKNKKLLKAQVFFSDSKQIDSIVKNWKNEQLILSVSQSDVNLEINDINSSKGKALEHYCHLLNIPVENVAVFGDDLNDVSMFEMFENSYAVGNSSEEVKNKARYVIKTNNEEGVAETLENILKEKRKEN